MNPRGIESATWARLALDPSWTMRIRTSIGMGPCRFGPSALFFRDLFFATVRLLGRP